MNIDEIKEQLAKLSKPELDKLMKNLKRINFDFEIGKSFLNYCSHPITIPREFYLFMDIQGIIKKQDATILFPDGSVATGYIHYSKAGWGEYHQIRVRNPYSGIGISKLKVGDMIRVEIYKDVDKTKIELSYL